MVTPPLVGREEPLRRLSLVIDEALAGVGRLVLISGEPGVGKTRLALDVLGEARRRGARSAVGACWDGDGAPDLWPWVQVLRALRVALANDGSRRASQSGNDALSFLLEGEQATPPTEFHLFESTLQFLTGVCEEQALVVLLEDLHWADPGSLALVEFLHHHAVHLPLLLVGTYRSDELSRVHHPQRGSVADLAQKAVTVPLAGLDNDGIRQVRENLGVKTTVAEAEHLRRLTGGNPFFVIESVAFTDPAESLGVRRAIDRRVDALGETERRVLTVASLIGRDSSDALVAAVAGDGAQRALEVIVGSGLMWGGGGQHTFVHDLVRETLRDRLSAEERRAVYAMIVRAADTPALGACLLPSQLAWLATEAVPDIPAKQAVAWLKVAADEALARLTPEAAGRHLEEAARLADDAEERDRLTLASGHAYHRAGALTLARERYASLLTGGDVETRARALLGLHRLGDQAAVGEESEVQRQLDAIDAELARTSDEALRAEVLAARSRARAHLLADDRSGTAPMAAEALQLAREAGQDTTIASCLLAYHDAIWQPGTEEERQMLADELARTGRRLADPVLEAQGLLLRMVAEIERGDPGYIVTHGQFDAVATASGSPRLQFLAASRRGMLAAMHARLPAAIVEIDSARSLGERVGEPDAVGMWCDQRWQVARHAGDTDTVGEVVTILRDMGDPHWMVYEAMLAVDMGEPDRAGRLAPQVAGLGRRWPRWAARLWDVFNVHLAIIGHELDPVADLIARLERDVGHWAVLGGGVLVHGPVCMWLGRLEAARGNWERALSLATEAESAALPMDAQLWLLEARADRLVAQHSIGAADAIEVASTLATSHELGFTPIADRLRALVSVAPPVPRNVFRRDHDVWTLAFAGVEVRMPDTKGLRDLRTLLAHPRVEILATSLATDAPVSNDAVPVLDKQAKAAYRHRLDDLDRELDRAALRGDAGRAERLEKERGALLDELRRAAGLAGRDRDISSDRERVRKTVTARMRDTLRKLDERHPMLASHLRASIHTGAACVYVPAEPVSWDLG